MFVIPSSLILSLYWTRSKRLKTNFHALMNKGSFFNFLFESSDAADLTSYKQSAGKYQAYGIQYSSIAKAMIT